MIYIGFHLRIVIIDIYIYMSKYINLTLRFLLQNWN